MNQVLRKTSLALLIVIVIGIGTASAHMATHASADLLTCDLCPGQGNPAHAIPPALSLAIVPQATFIPFRDIQIVHVSTTRPSFQQRAPPATR